MSDPNVIRIKPFYYIHVLDNNTNVTRVEVGPQTFTRQDHEKVVAGPEAMIMVPPRHYCIVANPVEKKNGKVVHEKNLQVKLRHGDEEIRMGLTESPEPFPLYPGEVLSGKVTPLQVVAPNTALRLKCIRDFTDEAAKLKRQSGDEWLFKGPGTYIPRIEVQVVQIQKASTIKPNQALRLRAVKDTVDIDGKARKTGEEWLVRTAGAYLLSVEEELVNVVDAYVLTDKKAIQLRALRTFEDIFKVVRKAGEEWLVTVDMAETHIPDVYEQVVCEVKLTSLNSRQYAVVVDPWKNGKQMIGQKELRRGECSFFLKPGETLEKGIQNVYVLQEDEALLLKAIENFTDAAAKKEHKAGDRWMLTGPIEYVPSIQVEVVERRKAIPLDENEGIYVRDIQTGRVRIVKGEAYLLKPNEELWKKELSAMVEKLLARDRSDVDAYERDKTRCVTYRAPHNSAVQIYDYKQKKARVVFGPELIMLDPDEQFTVLSLSGDQPKRADVIKDLCLRLGPDFMNDVVIVETADHARLSLTLSYNWYFEVDRTKPEEATKLFQVPDFVGDSCKAIASRVRAAVASTTFDEFHKRSAAIIRSAVFGQDKEETRTKFHFSANNLVITNIDIQSVEPVDQRTRDSLQKSVQLAIEITTKSQEAKARHENARLEQEAVGLLERQKIKDEAAAENSRRELISLQTETAAVESTGQAKAEAIARAESAKIEALAAVKQAELQVQAQTIKSEAELARLQKSQAAEIEHQKKLIALEIEKAEALAEIEAEKTRSYVKAIGPNTLRAMAEAGPNHQIKLLQSLGLQSMMITDGNSPINLFNTAKGLVQQQQP